MPSPQLSRVGVHPLLSFASPLEYVAACHLPDAREHQAPPLGFSFPFATLVGGVHSPSGIPAPDFVSSTAFLTLSTTCSSAYGVGLFHPTATSGIRTSGVFLAAKPARLIDESFPLVVDDFLLPAGFPVGSRFSRVASRAFIRAAIRCDLQVG
jgi:hypothetical protein